MQLMDAALLDVIQKKQVDPDDAIRFASDKSKFQRYLTDTESVPIVEDGGNRMLSNS